MKPITIFLNSEVAEKLEGLVKTINPGMSLETYFSLVAEQFVENFQHIPKDQLYSLIRGLEERILISIPPKNQN